MVKKSELIYGDNMIDKILGIIDNKETIRNLNENNLEDSSIVNKRISDDADVYEIFKKTKYDNFKILVKTYQIVIIGSVRKFMAKEQGKDLVNYNPTRKDIIVFHQIIKKRLGIDISEMKLYKLESGVTLITENKVDEYLDEMIYLPKTKKNTFGNNAKKFSFSSKNNLYKAKSINIYDNGKLYNKKDINSIRIELAIPKLLKRNLKLEETLVYSDLFNEDIWLICYDKIVNILNDIGCKRIPIVDDNNITTPNDLVNFLIDYYLADEDNQNMLDGLLYESILANKDFDSSKLQKQRNAIRKNQYKYTMNTELKNELINKVIEEFDYLIRN